MIYICIQHVHSCYDNHAKTYWVDVHVEVSDFIYLQSVFFVTDTGRSDIIHLLMPCGLLQIYILIQKRLDNNYDIPPSISCYKDYNKSLLSIHLAGLKLETRRLIISERIYADVSFTKP